MKIIQTFWSGGSKLRDNPFDLKAGWLSCEYHWMSWTLSCLQLSKFYPQVELITDNLGKEILIDALELPYTKVSTVLENTLDKYPSELWSLAKIFSYNIQEEQFIHLDGDVFLWQPLDDKFMNADLSAQNLEAGLSYYQQSLKEIGKYFSYFPGTLNYLIESDSTINASNTGIFGGRDIPFIKSYCDTAFTFIDKNIESLDKVNKANLNFIFEQCFLYYLAKAQNRQISYLIEEPVTEPSYIDYTRFIDIPDVKMIHTVGGYKRMEIICDHLAKRLRKDYPEYYYRIISLCKQNDIKLKNSVYYFPMFNGYNGSPETSAKAKYSNNYGTEFMDKGKCDFSTNYFRTTAALKYIGSPDTFSSKAYDVPLPDNERSLYTNIESMNGNEKTEILREIYNLENHKRKLKEKLKDISFIHSAYCNDVINYEQTEDLFSKSESGVLGTPILLSSFVTLVELNRNWAYNSKLESVEKFIEKKLNEDSSVAQVALVVNPLKMSIDEIYLDQVDMVIVNVCADNTSVKDALQLIKQFFDPDEVNEGYKDYQKLIFDSIKRLMYCGILRSN